MRPREELILRHIDLVRKTAKRLARRLGGDPEEFEADGMVGLIEAANRYKPEENDNFAAYAQSRIRGSILDEYRKIDPIGRGERTLQKNDPKRSTKKFIKQNVYPKDANAWDLLLNYAGDQIVELEKKYLRKMLKVLPPQHQRVLQMYYIEQKTHAEIGDIMNVSPSRSCQLHKQALTMVREDLKKKGFI